MLGGLKPEAVVSNKSRPVKYREEDDCGGREGLVSSTITQQWKLSDRTYISCWSAGKSHTNLTNIYTRI